MNGMETRTLGNGGLAVSEEGSGMHGHVRVLWLLGRSRVDRVALRDEDLQRIDEAAPVGAAAGDRYPDMSRVSG
jgi:hypothetical protein